MESMLRDIKFAWVGFLRRPGYTFTVVLTLALGIAATVTIFSVVYGVSLAPLPFAEAEDLLWAHGTWTEGQREGISSNDFRDYRRESRSFASLVAASSFSPLYNLTSVDSPVQLRSREVSSGFFSALGVEPLLGREFLPQEEKDANSRVVILSRALWQEIFDSSSDAIGGSISLNGRPYTVVGVMPAWLDFLPWLDFLGETDLWEPQRERGNAPALRQIRFLVMFGRLGDGVSKAQAQAEMSALAQRLAETYPDVNRDRGIALEGLQEKLLGASRRQLMILLAAVGALLLITMANVAGIMLARMADRDGETALRIALGASRGRLVRQFLTESLLLGLFGGALGTLLAYWGIRLFQRYGPPGLPRLEEVSLNLTMLLFAVGVSLLTGLFCGSLPALRASRLRLSRRLQAATPGARSRARAGSLLVIAEVALSVALLIGAGLLARTLFQLQAADLGFRPGGLLTTRLVLPAATYGETERRNGFWEELLTRLEALPGVENAGLVTELPLTGQDNPSSFEATTQEGEKFVVNMRAVSPGYLDAMGIPVLEGRALLPRDRDGQPRVLVINRRAEREIFGGESAVGKFLTFDFGGNPFAAEVVGVTGDIRHQSLSADPFREAYFPVYQTPLLTLNLVIGTSLTNAESLSQGVREVVREIDPNQAVGEFSTMQALVDQQLRSPRFRSSLLGAFSALALLISAVGIYALLSFVVSMRTRELGVRMAFGADRKEVFRLVLRQGLGLVVPGLALGVGLAFFLQRWMGSLLYGVGSFDIVSFAGGALVLGGVACLASLLPGARASRLDPVEALRVD